MRSGTKIFIGFVALVAGGCFAYSRITSAMILGKHFPKIEPGRVNLLGVDTGKGYRIVVQNQIATLIQGASEEFSAPDNSTTKDDAGDVSDRRRIPIREMLQTLQGDTKALSALIAIMNDIHEGNLPPVRVIWDAADVKRAIDGDASLRARLEDNLGVHLDGTPLAQIRFSSVQNVIVLRCPVDVKVPDESGKRVMTGTILQPYKPVFSQIVESQYEEKANVTHAMILGYIRTEADRLQAEPNARENVSQALLARIDPERLRNFAAAPERVLQSAQVVINDDSIEGATRIERDSTNGVRFYDLRIDLTDDGRQRLWQYSKLRVGSQLLLVVDGIAIGAPRIEHELVGGEVTISQLPDKTLVDDAVQLMNNAKKRGKQQ